MFRSDFLKVLAMFFDIFFRARTTAACQTKIMGWRPDIERRGWNFEGGGWGNLSKFIFKIIFHFQKKRFIFQNSRLKLMMVFTMSLWKIMIMQMKGKSWVYQLILRVRIQHGLSMTSRLTNTLLLFWLIYTMAIGVVEFSREGYKIRKVFA